MAELAPLVLCVDDNDGTRYALTRTMQRAGFRTIEAATGTEALRRMEESPDVVVLDVHLPDLSGYAVCQRIKADPQTASTPVLQVSADFIEVEHRTRGLDMGADAYLAQPIAPPELIATIRSLLRARRAEEKARSVARELQKVAEEREKLVNELRIADRRKDEFLAMLAHELRNPLAAVIGGLHVLEGVGSKEPKARQTRATILRQMGVLTRLVDDLLDVSRITRGKVELRKEPLLLGEAVEHAVCTSRPLLDERRHELTVELPDEALWVLADATRIEQVISNLLNNSAKYTEPGGRIRVSLRRDGDQAVLLVRDTGLGIEPAMLERIFELFAQADQSSARSRGGLGVGLTLVKRLLEMHGGDVRARSEGLNRGSEFEVRLPLLREEAGTIGQRRRVFDAGRKHLLLIEDNPDIGETLRELLQMLGHRVELAGDGLRGVQVALATGPDAALVDIGLPGIDGYEVARRIRATEAGSRIMLVALTGYGRPEDRDRALQSGFDAHLVKPVDLDELNHLLAGLGGCRQEAGQA